MRGYLRRRCSSVGVVLSRRHNLHLASVLNTTKLQMPVERLTTQQWIVLRLLNKQCWLKEKGGILSENIFRKLILALGDTCSSLNLSGSTGFGHEQGSSWLEYCLGNSMKVCVKVLRRQNLLTVFSQKKMQSRYFWHNFSSFQGAWRLRKFRKRQETAATTCGRKSNFNIPIRFSLLPTSRLSGSSPRKTLMETTIWNVSNQASLPTTSFLTVFSLKCIIYHLSQIHKVILVTSIFKHKKKHELCKHSKI